MLEPILSFCTNLMAARSQFKIPPNRFRIHQQLPKELCLIFMVSMNLKTTRNLEKKSESDKDLLTGREVVVKASHALYLMRNSKYHDLIVSEEGSVRVCTR